MNATKTVEIGNKKMAKIFMSEKDVETHFRKLLEDATGSQFLTLKKLTGEHGGAWATDGVIEWTAPCSTSVKVLLETKFGTDLKNPQTRSSVLAQALYYCKKFENRGEDTPSVIFVGDDKLCFALEFGKVQEFMGAQIDWSRAPSSPDKALTDAISEKGISAHYESTLGVDGESLKKLCEELTKGCVYKVKPTKHNISAMFQYWVDHIIPQGKYSPVEMTDIFFGCVLYTEEQKIARTLSGKKVLIGGREYELNVGAMDAWFERRQRGLKPSEIEELVSMRDRIIEDDTRRRQGAFYTPTLWVDEAHSEMDKVLGSSWRDDCIVWDCCAGTGNLTRDYKFKNLIISTAESPDVQALKREGYNKSFQYDFLNPDSESPFFGEEDGDNVLPLAVKKLLREGAKAGKRLVFLINPPYATANNAGAKGTAKAGVAQTIANGEMKKAKLGACSQQLYAQFLFQCEQVASEYGFKKKSVGVFSPILYMVSGSFAKFRPFWYERYSYQSGFMFQASHFADVKGSWAISFTLWSEGKTDIKQGLPVTLKDMEDESVISLSEKLLYTSDGREASSWVRELVKGLKTFDAPQMKSGLSIGQDGRGKQTANSLFYFSNNGNSLQDSQTLAYFTSSCGSRANGTSVLAGEGWRRAIALYSARKLSKDTWVTHNDEYLAPQTELEGYDQWVDDCHIYALLENKNNMSAMRDVEYKGKKHNIHNHFFWLTRAEALKLYDDNRANGLYRDAKMNPIPYEVEEEMGEDITPQWRKEGDPYFSHVLPTLNLSPLAKEIMGDLNKLFIKSLTLRASTGSVEEKGKQIDLHLGAWDSGIYQHKKLWATDANLKADWDSLKAKHRELAKSLEHGVYTYGFLKK